MPASVTLHQLSYSTPDNHPLFSRLDLSFGPGRTGLIGRNGTGKSTLLRIIAGDIAPSAGSASASGSIGMLEQAVRVAADEIIGTYLGVGAALERLARLEAGTGSVEDAGEADWTLPGRITQALESVGLPDYDPERLLSA